MEKYVVIDLHIHSTASDGSFSPAEIVHKAVLSSISAISITDHDTIDGIKEIIETGIPHNIDFITGVELSAQPPVGYEESGSIHILGYGFSIYDKEFNAVLEKLKNVRFDRNPKIIKKLNDLGFNITMDDVQNICGNGQMGRPHIAKAMVQKGYVSSFDDAFDFYLGNGKPAYVDKFRLSCKDAVDLIINAGGIPVLAHPGIIKINTEYNPKKQYSIEYLISNLIGMGLMGIEVFHTDHSKEQSDYFAKIASKKGLIITGGSDFHGTLKPEVEIGRGNNNLSVDHNYYKILSAAVDKVRKANNDISKLEENLYYSFKDKSLLDTALCHSSYVNESSNNITDNQRLEFLGDAVLGLAVGQILMQKFPEMKEGDLSKLRSTLVSESGLASIARYMDIGRFLYLGKGERLSRGGEKNSILADAFEAVIAAIYLDLGFNGTFELISYYFNSQINQIASGSNDTCDYKSMLQELVQEMGNFVPCYKILNETGPDHDKTFEVVLNVCDIEAKGEGKNKKSAEQNAAANAFELLKKNREILI